MSEYLDSRELKLLTDYKYRSKQAEWLKLKGIPFKLDGARLVVAKTHVQNWIEGKLVVQRGGMNLAAIK